MDRFDEVIEEIGPSIVRIASSFASPGPEREDLLQEVMLALWQALPRFRGDSSIRTYVFRIVHNVVVDHVWRRRRTQERKATLGQPPTEKPHGPHDQLAGKEAGEKLLEAVRALPLGQKQVMTLALEGLSHDEVGEVLGITENNVAVRLHRARKALRKARRKALEVDDG